MEDTDILTLGWGCEPGPPPLWPSSEEFVTLDMDSCSSGGESQDYVTLEVCKERDREYYNSQLETEKRKEWDMFHPVAESRQPMAPVYPHDACFYPQYPQPAPVVHYDPYYHHHHQQAYPHHQPHYANIIQDPRRHAVRSPTSGKFVRGFQVIQSRVPDPQVVAENPQESVAQLAHAQQTKERKRPGPKPKIKPDEGGGGAAAREEPVYDQATIDAAHLTVEDDAYVCSVCKMKFKQPGNARRHIITVHRNEKPHECSACGTKFGRKDKLKTHMIRNHGFDQEDIKRKFQHNTSGRKRSSILVNRKGRESTESTSEDESNPLNLKTYSSPEKKAVTKHLNTSQPKRRRT